MRHALLSKPTPSKASEVQILGSLIGTGLSDTGTGDATNLLVSTQQAFSGPDWITTNATMADINATGPTGSSTASTLTETAVSGQHWTAQGFSTAASVAQYSLAISLLQGLRTRAIVVFRDNVTAGNNATCTFDLAGGAIGVAAAVNGTFASPSATITAQSNGFYRCVLTATTSGSGNYDIEVYADNGSGSGASSSTYTGNASGAALSIDNAGVWAGAAGTYVPLNANGGAAASTVQQVFSPNGVTTAYWGTQTSNAYVTYDAGLPVVPTRHRFVPRPSSPTAVLTSPFTADYATTIEGALIQIDVADSTFASPTTVDTLPAANVLPYYPRFWLHDRPISSGLAARYIRLKPPTAAFGGVSAWQVFARAGTNSPACPMQPVISPMGGKFPGLYVNVSITTRTAGASIYYTLDGSTPTTSSTLYGRPFQLAITSGTTVTVKAIAYLVSLSTPTSLVTTSAPFCGYGFHPNDNQYDERGNLIEAHSASVIWDPNTLAHYMIGVLMNVASVNTPGQSWNDPISTPPIYLYKGTPLDQKDPGGLLNWKNLGPILTGIPAVAGLTHNSRLRILYNALNNNYIIFANPVNGTNQSLFYASTPGADITSGWSWNTTPLISNTFLDFTTLVDSDGVTAYLIWRNASTGINIKQLNTSYTALIGSALALAGGTAREGIVAWKYPNATGGTYFIITGELNAYNSAAGEYDLRFITSSGSTPLVNSWSGSPATGASAWASDPLGGNFNGQPTFVFYPQGKLQPMIGLDYWLGQGAGSLGLNYGSRYIWQPLTMTGSTARIQQSAAWDPSQLATVYPLVNLTLSASTFQVGAAQGTSIGTVAGYILQSWVTLTDSHSGAVQLVGGAIQVGPTPPGGAGSFNISLTETPNVGSPHVTIIAITESTVAPRLSGSVATFTTNQSINVTTLAASGLSDWAAFGALSGTASSIERKATGGSAISALSQVGSIALGSSSHIASTPHWAVTWSDGTPDATPTPDPEGYIVFCSAPSGPANTGMSFTVPADTNLRTLDVYVAVSNNGTTTTSGKLTATLSDASAGPYVDTGVGTISTDSAAKLGHYTIQYEAASASQLLTVSWVNNTASGQNVQLFAAVIE